MPPADFNSMSCFDDSTMWTKIMMRLIGFYGMPLATYEYKPDATEFLYHGSIVTLHCVCNAHEKHMAD